LDGFVEPSSKPSIRHDALIAASSRERSFMIITNNVADFELIAPYVSKPTFARPYP
jgi:predicted nucleic acid-binding protein